MNITRKIKNVVLNNQKNIFFSVIFSFYLLIVKGIRLIIVTYNRKFSKKNFSLEIFKNKRIAIIGPADSVFDEENGHYIDQFDVVVRINNSINNSNFKLNNKYIGSKTTVLFHGLDESPIMGCGKVTPSQWKKQGVEMVIFPLYEDRLQHQLNNYYYLNNKHLPIMQVNSVLYQNIVNSLDDYRPSTGFAAIYMILQSQFKELYVSGFTFFKTPHVKGYKEGIENNVEVNELIKKFNIHNPENEYKLFKKLVKSSNKNIKMDNVLNQLINKID